MTPPPPDNYQNRSNAFQDPNTQAPPYPGYGQPPQGYGQPSAGPGQPQTEYANPAPEYPQPAGYYGYANPAPQYPQPTGYYGYVNTAPPVPTNKQALSAMIMGFITSGIALFNILFSFVSIAFYFVTCVFILPFSIGGVVVGIIGLILCAKSAKNLGEYKNKNHTFRVLGLIFNIIGLTINALFAILLGLVIILIVIAFFMYTA